MSLSLCVLLSVLCLVAMAFFAGTEMGFISCNRIKLRHLAELGNRRARMVEKILSRPERFLSTTLVGVNLFVVLAASILNNYLSHVVGGGKEAWISLLISWPLVLIFGQIVPMGLFRQHANTISLQMAYPLRATYYLLYPLVLASSAISNLISRLFGRGPRRNPFVTREELKLLLKEGERSGRLRGDEKEMIREIFDFGGTEARSVMVPLIDVVAAPETATAGEVGRLIAETGFSRIPIFRKRVDRVIGTVNAADLIEAEAGSPVTAFVRGPYIVPETKLIEEILRELRKNRKHMAVVVDEYGGVSGVLTLEDIIEEIVGEIEDEYDRQRPREIVFREDTVLVDGKARVEDLNEELGLRLPEEEAETVAGLLVIHLSRIPRTGDTVVLEGLTFLVEEATDRRIVRLRILKAPSPPPEEDDEDKGEARG